MRRDTRERLTAEGAPDRVSDRAFGVAFAAAFAVIGAVAWLASATLSAWLFVISGALLVVAFLTPGALAPLNALRAGFLFPFSPPPPPPLRISPHTRHYLVEYAVRVRGAAARRACGRGLAPVSGSFHRKHEGVGQGCS